MMNRDELIERAARARIRTCYGPQAIFDSEPVSPAEFDEMAAAFKVIDQAGFVIVPREPNKELAAKMAWLAVSPTDWQALLEAAALQEKVP